MKKLYFLSTLLCLLFFTINVQSQAINDNGTNVGIGTTAPPTTTTTNIRLDVKGNETNGDKGAQIAQRYTATSNYSSTNSTTSGLIGYNSNWSAGSLTWGMSSDITVSTARAYSKTSQTMSGRFITDLGAVSGSREFQIAGAYGHLKGAWNGASVNGGFAAGVVGIDEINGVATYGGYFEGKGYFSGKVSVGTSNMPTTIGGANISAYHLYVKGGILTEEVRVRTGWADYVFADDYNLKPLSEVESFIKENKHLPNVPSSKQVEKEGISLGNIAKIQQEKIEELTLYTIEQDKKIESQQKELEKENNLLKSLLERVSKLEEEIKNKN